MQPVNSQEEPPPVCLTKRETQILRLCAEPLRAKQIADRLFLSKRTVDFHMQNVYDKIGVRSRYAAVLWGIRAGIVPALTEGGLRK